MCYEREYLKTVILTAASDCQLTNLFCQKREKVLEKVNFFERNTDVAIFEPRKWPYFPGGWISSFFILLLTVF